MVDGKQKKYLLTVANAGSIHADDLEQFTGFTDRHHRVLAKTGYFQPPRKAFYDASEALRGMFKYCREKFASSARERKSDEEHRKIKMQNDKNAGLLVERAEVAKKVQQIFGSLLPRLEQKLVTEYPSAICVDVVQGRIYGKRLFDQITEAAREFEAEWKKI